MNKVMLMGRLTRDPNVRYSTGENNTAVARYTLAVDRRGRRDEENNADFISCVAFGKSAEFAEKYLHRGTKVVVTGRIQTGSYVNSEGAKIYTTDVVVEDQEFAESKNNAQQNEYAGASAPVQNRGSNAGNNQNRPGLDGFMNIPDGYDYGELPF